MTSHKLRIPNTNLTITTNRMSILDGFTFEDIEYLVDTNPYLRGYLQGYLAELALSGQLKAIPGVSSVKKIPDADTRKGDLEVIYKDYMFTIECKSIESSSVREDTIHDSWIGTVGIKNSDRRTLNINGEDVQLCNLSKGTFDILAVSCFAVSNKWNFLFIENQYLQEHGEFPGFISTKISISPDITACVTDDLVKLFDKAIADKNSKPC